MSTPDLSSVLERQLLLQLGDRLKRLRKARGLSTTAMAERVGISRNTLRAIENGDPSPSMGSFVRVMSVLGVAGELALLAGDSMLLAPKGTAAARVQRGKPVIQITVTADDSRHAVQDLQSLALHEAAVELVKADPSLILKAQETLGKWMEKPGSRSSDLWMEWGEILYARNWRKVLAKSRHAQELRQSSPLVTVLTPDARKQVLDQIAALKKGVVFGQSVSMEET
jgi:transcriptional regulator with XRE-family HTH domain